MADARAALESACGEVLDAGAADAVDGVVPDLVTRPASTAEVAEVMRVAAEHGLAVVPRGCGTKFTWGRPPARADVVVDLSAMGRVLDHAAGDLILEAQAGARLTDVQRAVAAEQQRLAVEETIPGASVGGTLATAVSGPSRVAFGTMRDLLIGVTVVRADGVVAKAGGRVVKNVAGYDLGKLIHGSYGTLAVVTDALFRLHPLPAARRFVSVPVTDPAAAHAAVQTVVHSQVVPGAVEVDLPGDGPGAVTVLLEGIAEGVLGRTSSTLDLLGAEAVVAEEAPEGWARYPWDPSAVGDDRATALKLTCALSGLAEVLGTARDVDIPVRVRGSGGAGVLYAAIPSGAEPGEIPEAVDRIREACTRHGGSLVVLDAPATVKQTVDTWGPVPALGLMRRVKDEFDPDHRLAPGRFVGGI